MFISRATHVKEDVVNNGAGGVQNLVSLSRVDGAGHLVSFLFFSLSLFHFPKIAIQTYFLSDHANESYWPSA